MPRRSRRAVATGGAEFEVQLAMAMSLSSTTATSQQPPPPQQQRDDHHHHHRHHQRRRQQQQQQQTPTPAKRRAQADDSTQPAGAIVAKKKARAGGPAPASAAGAATGSGSSGAAAADMGTAQTTVVASGAGAAAEEPYVDPLPPTLLVIDRERPLKSLGESGLIPFGQKVLYMKYKTYEWWVDLRPDGVLTHHGGDGKEYVNPSSFSLAMKRSITAGVVADSGWESLRHNGRKLAHIRDGVETLLRERKVRQLKRGGSGAPAVPGLSKAQQSALFKGLDRRKEALVKEVITHYNVAKVADNADARLKRRRQQSLRNYSQLASVIQKLKQKDRYGFFQEPVDLATHPDYASQVPHPPIDFSEMHRRYRASKRVLDSTDKDSAPVGDGEDLYMVIKATGDGNGVADIKYDRLLRDVTHIAENARAYNEEDSQQGSAYFEAGWMLEKCQDIIRAFQQRVTNTLRQQRQRDRREMIREKNRQPCVQGKWHKLPYPKREYRLLTAYEPSTDLDPAEAARVMDKLETTMTRADFVAAVDAEDRKVQQQRDEVAAGKAALAAAQLAAKEQRRALALQKGRARQRRSDPTAVDPEVETKKKMEAAVAAAGAAGTKASAADVEAAAAAAPPSTEKLALEKTCKERATVQWLQLQLDGGDILERDTWGIDCYTRRNIELALGLVPPPLTMTRSQAAYFVENVFLPAVNAVEDANAAHDIQNTLKLLLEWYSGPALNGTFAETGPPATGAGVSSSQQREWIQAPVGAETVCAICGSAERPDEALLCDGPNCELEFHMSCLKPRLAKVPEGDFIGPCCGGHGAPAKDAVTSKGAEEEPSAAVAVDDEGPAQFVLRADGQKTWIPSLADRRAPRREQIAAGVAMIAEVVQDVGLQHFAIHPKGCGVICATEKTIPANCFVTEYLGAVYPAWKWVEKDHEEEEQRARERQEQQRLQQEKAAARRKAAGAAPGGPSRKKGSKGKNRLGKGGSSGGGTDSDGNDDGQVAFQVPEFYNIRLERNHADPRGYDLLYVDAKDVAAFSSRMSHSCAPNCALEGTIRNGKYTIAVRTLRPIRPGEELTQDYNCVTESEQEFRAAVCLCGGVGCRGSFLNFMGATMESLLLKQHHTRLQRLALLCSACAPGAPPAASLAKNDEASALAHAIASVSCLGSCALADQPTWGLRWCAAVLRFMSNERKFLPRELDEVQTLMQATGVKVGVVENDRVAANVYEQRMSNLVTALDIIRHCVSFPSSSSSSSSGSDADSTPVAAPNASSQDASAPLRALSESEAVEFLVGDGESSVLNRTLSLTTAALRSLLAPPSRPLVAGAPTTPLERTVAAAQQQLAAFNEKLLASWDALERRVKQQRAACKDEPLVVSKPSGPSNSSNSSGGGGGGGSGGGGGGGGIGGGSRSSSTEVSAGAPATAKTAGSDELSAGPGSVGASGAPGPTATAPAADEPVAPSVRLLRASDLLRRWLNAIVSAGAAGGGATAARPQPIKKKLKPGKKHVAEDDGDGGSGVSPRDDDGGEELEGSDSEDRGAAAAADDDAADDDEEVDSDSGPPSQASPDGAEAPPAPRKSTQDSPGGGGAGTPTSTRAPAPAPRKRKSSTAAAAATPADGAEAYSKTLQTRVLGHARAVAWRAVQILRLYATTRHFFVLSSAAADGAAGGSGGGGGGKGSKGTQGGADKARELLGHTFQWFDQRRLDVPALLRELRLTGYLPPVYRMRSFDVCCATPKAKPLGSTHSAANGRVGDSSSGSGIPSTNASGGSRSSGASSGGDTASSGSSATTSNGGDGQPAPPAPLSSLSTADITARLAPRHRGGVAATFDWAHRNFVPHLRASPFDAPADKLAAALGFPAPAAEAAASTTASGGDTAKPPASGRGGGGDDEDASRGVLIHQLVFGSPVLDVAIDHEKAQLAAAAKAAAQAAEAKAAAQAAEAKAAAKSKAEAAAAAVRGGGGGGGGGAGGGGGGREKEEQPAPKKPTRRSRETARRFPALSCGAAYAEVVALLRDAAGNSARLVEAKAAQRRAFQQQQQQQRQQRAQQARARPTLVAYHSKSKKLSQKKQAPNAYILFSKAEMERMKKSGVFDPEKGTRMAQIGAAWKALDEAARASYEAKAAVLAKKFAEESRRAKAQQQQQPQAKDKAKTTTPGEQQEQAQVVELFWAQCECCGKWRSLPQKWTRDAFRCADNSANPTLQSCDAPEEAWDQDETADYAYEGVTFDPLQVAVGDYLDVCDPGQQWFAGKCKERRGNECLIHYLNFRDRFDEWIDTRSDGWRLAELMTHVKATKALLVCKGKMEQKRQAAAGAVEVEDQVPAPAATAKSPAAAGAAAVEAAGDDVAAQEDGGGPWASAAE